MKVRRLVGVFSWWYLVSRWEVQTVRRIRKWVRDTCGYHTNEFSYSTYSFGRGEGVVVIVLKPLDAAVRDGDHIYGSVSEHAETVAGHR